MRLRSRNRVLMTASAKDPSRTRQYRTRQYGDRSVSAYTSRHDAVLCPSAAPGERGGGGGGTVVVGFA